MKRFRNLSGGTGIVIGILVTLILVPTAAVAAANFTIVRVKGASGQSANVTHNSQLLTTEADPTSYHLGMVQITGTDPENCQTVATPPPGKALILDHVILADLVTGKPVPDPNLVYDAEGIDLTVDPVADNCDGTIGADVAVATVNGPGTETISLAPGYAVPAGYELNIRFGYWNGSSNTIAYSYGYTVPANDVGATPQNLAHGRKLDFPNKG